jgi:hypothetical protein
LVRNGTQAAKETPLESQKATDLNRWGIGASAY